jgi:hypothetical protein
MVFFNMLKKKKPMLSEETQRQHEDLNKKLDDTNTELDKLLERLRSKHPSLLSQ